MARISEVQRYLSTRANTPDFLWFPFCEMAGTDFTAIARVGGVTTTATLPITGTTTNIWDNDRVYTPTGDNVWLAAESTGDLDMTDHFDPFFAMDEVANTGGSYLFMGIAQYTSMSATELIWYYGDTTDEGIRLQLSGSRARMVMGANGTTITTTHGSAAPADELFAYQFFYDLSDTANAYGYENGVLGETDDISGAAPYPSQSPSGFTFSLSASMTTGPVAASFLNATNVGQRVGPQLLVKFPTGISAANLATAIAQHQAAPFEFPPVLFNV